MATWKRLRRRLGRPYASPAEIQALSSVPRRPWEEVPFSKKPWRWRRRRGRFAVSFQTELPFSLPLGDEDQWVTDVSQPNELTAVAHDGVRLALGSSTQHPELPQHLSVVPDWDKLAQHFVERALPKGKTLAEFVVAPGRKWQPTDVVLTRCFDQGLEALNRLLAEYAIATMDPEVHEISKEELPALALVTFKDLKAPYYAHTFIRLHKRDALIKEPLPGPMLDRIAAQVCAPEAQSGMHPFHVQRVRADRLIDQGRYGECIVAAAIAIEALVAWLLRRRLEEVDDAIEVESLFEQKGILRIVKSELHGWLGGRWNTDDPTTAAGQWRVNIHDIRTRCVHLGYRPNYREARAALEAGRSISSYSFERLRVTGRADWLDPSRMIADPLRGNYFWEFDRWEPEAAN